jgi:hypothetical protein
MYRHTLRGAALYEPEPYAGDITLVGAGEAEARWRRICLGDLRVVEDDAALPGVVMTP